MRLIKFRAWHEETEESEAHMDYNPKVKNKWVTVYEARENTMTMDTERVASFYLNDAFIPQEGIILMQVTGLIDKNGKDIFEGDILKKALKGYAYKTNGNRYTVAEWKATTNYTGWSLAKGERKWEIIGNIYENPSLIS